MSRLAQALEEAEFGAVVEFLESTEHLIGVWAQIVVGGVTGNLGVEPSIDAARQASQMTSMNVDT